MNELRLAHMKKAIREAMPAGAGDFTVTSVAKAAIEASDEWQKRAAADAQKADQILDELEG